MARVRFPSDRLAYTYTGPGQPLLAPDSLSFHVYLDQACTTLADITTLSDVSITGSLITTGDDTLLPEWMGPADGTTTLWLKPTSGGAAYEVFGNYELRVENLETLLGTLGLPAFHFVQNSPSATWTITHGLGYHPNVSAFDSGLSQVEGDVTHVSTSQLTILFSAAISGTAELS